MQTTLIVAAMVGSYFVILFLGDVDFSQPRAILVSVSAVAVLLAVGYFTNRPAALFCAFGLLVVLALMGDWLTGAGVLDSRGEQEEVDPGPIPYSFVVPLVLPSVALILLGQLLAHVRARPQ